MRQYGWIAARRRLRAEDFDHADDGSQQAHQWRYRGNRAQCHQVSLHVVRHRATGFFQRFLHQVAAYTEIADAGHQHTAEQRTFGKRAQQIRVCAMLAEVRQSLFEQVGGQHTCPAQGVASLEDDCKGQHGCDDKGPDRPAGGFNES